MWHTIVFMQGDEGREVVDQLCNVEGVVAHGITVESVYAAVEHLKQWDYGDESEHSPEEREPWGPHDEITQMDDYTLSWHLGLGYVGLYRNTSHVNYPHFPGRLYDCPACEERCHCSVDGSECVWSGHQRRRTIYGDYVAPAVTVSGAAGPWHIESEQGGVTLCGKTLSGTLSHMDLHVSFLECSRCMALGEVRFDGRTP